MEKNEIEKLFRLRSFKRWHSIVIKNNPIILKDVSELVRPLNLLLRDY